VSAGLTPNGTAIYIDLAPGGFRGGLEQRVLHENNGLAFALWLLLVGAISLHMLYHLLLRPSVRPLGH
jgi:hypothetical protein